tara:strand:+ start:614 stop:1090 length:477 start_codon:yes stop_codon:yes gene_type:complete
MKQIRKLCIALLILGIIIIGCSQGTVPSNDKNKAAIDGNKITVFKSPNCGCCVGYVAELEKHGFDVEIIETTDMHSIKQKYKIPRSMESCHTAVIGDYFIEGHVPIEAVNKLLEENPEIDGITLPRMPAGSPGMPGIKKAPVKVYALSDGEASEFTTI